MEVTFNVDLEKFRYSLVGDGYLLEEVVQMTQGKLIEILEGRIETHIEKEYVRGKRYGLYDGTR